MSQCEQPDAYCYGAAMRACLRAGEYEEVRRLYRRMRRTGVPPNSHVLATLLSAVDKRDPGSSWRDARRYLIASEAVDDRSRAAASTTPPTPASGAGPEKRRDEGDGGATAEGRRRGRSAAGSQARESVSSVHAYTIVAGACKRAGRWREAIELLARMRRRGVRPNAFMYGATVGALAGTSQAGGGGAVSSASGAFRTRVAMRLLEQMEADGVALDAHVANAALVVCSRAGQWEAATELLSSLEGRGVRPSAYHVMSVLRSCTRQRRWREALLVLRAAEMAAVSFDPALGEAGLGVCARTGAWRQAISLLRRLSGEGVPLSDRMRCSAIAAIGHGPEWDLSLRLLATSSDTACHNAALSALRRHEQRERATALLRRMRERGPTPDAGTARYVAWLMNADEEPATNSL